MEVRVEVEVITERVDDLDIARPALGHLEGGELELGQGAVGNAAEFLDEPAMRSKIRAQHLGDSENEMTVWDRCENGLGQ